jgi:hypothetical protein
VSVLEALDKAAISRVIPLLNLGAAPMSFFRTIALAAALFATPALAAPKPEELAAARVAETVGAEMYAYDQAAWHGTDKFVEDLQRAEADQSLLRGYVVEPGGAGLLKATFFGMRDGKYFAFASYWVRGNKVERGGIIEPDGAHELSLLALRMIEVRQKAIEHLQKGSYAFCNRARPNTLILPPRADGSIPVYVMTAPVSNSSYPAGGHYRFDFDAQNKLMGERAFMRSCMDVRYGGRGSERAEAMVLTHLLDPQPTEVHVFVSRYVQIPLLVLTDSNEELWAITAGQIVPASKP